MTFLWLLAVAFCSAVAYVCGWLGAMNRIGKQDDYVEYLSRIATDAMRRNRQLDSIGSGEN